MKIILWIINTINILCIVLLLSIFYNYYELINVKNLIFFLINDAECCYDPYELLNVNVTLSSFLGGIYLVILNIILNKKKISLKLFFDLYKYKYNKILNVILTVIVSILIGLLLSSSETLKIFHYIFIGIILNNLIAFIYLFFTLLEIDKEDNYRKIKIDFIIHEMLKIEVGFEFEKMNINLLEFFQDLTRLEREKYFVSIMETIRLKFECPKLQLGAVKYFKNILE